MPCWLRAPQAEQWCGATSMVSPLPASLTSRPRPRSAVPLVRSTSSVVPRATWSTRTSDVKVPNLACLGVDEVLARSDLLTHQHREDRVGRLGMLDLGPTERPG